MKSQCIRRTPNAAVLAIIVVASVFTACTAPKSTHVKVSPKLCWHVHDYAGGPIGSPNYHEITNYWATNCYAPFVVSQGIPFTMDFAEHDSFSSPDSEKVEHYFDGVKACLTVSVSNTTAYFSGRADDDTDLGVTSSYYEDDRSLYGETFKSYSTRFSGTCALGHEMQIGAGEDIDDEPVVFFTLQKTEAPLSKFNPEILGEGK